MAKKYRKKKRACNHSSFRTVAIPPELEQKFAKQWETIGISSDFIFCKVMQEEELLAELIRLNKKWRWQYMTWQMRDLENQEIGWERGRQTGIQEGREEGQLEEQKNRIARMLLDGKTPQAIADFCKYPLQYLSKVSYFEQSKKNSLYKR